MADISKCNGVNCPVKETCYRYTAEANKRWQSYAAFAFDKETNRCDYYLNNKEYIHETNYELQDRLRKERRDEEAERYLDSCSTKV